MTGVVKPVLKKPYLDHCNLSNFCPTSNTIILTHILEKFTPTALFLSKVEITSITVYFSHCRTEPVLAEVVNGLLLPQTVDDSMLV